MGEGDAGGVDRSRLNSMRLKAGLLLAGSALTLAAHQILPFSLMHSEPAAGSVFADAPTRIRLIFGDKVDPSTARISLTDSTGQTITLAPAIDPHLADGIIAPVPPLRAGVYSVAWRVRSYGAEDISGSYTFAFGPHASLPSLPDSAQNQGPAAGTSVQMLNTPRNCYCRSSSLVSCGCDIARVPAERHSAASSATSTFPRPAPSAPDTPAVPRRVAG